MPSNRTIRTFCLTGADGAGKTALVTGSTSGIGLGIACRLAAQGANVVLNGFGDVEGPKAEVAAAGKAHGIRIGYHGADMSKPAEIEAMLAYAAKEFGGVDILVNNAGAAQGGAFLDLPDQVWRDSLNLKLFGYIRVAREVFPHLVRRGGGRIVNVIGMGGVQPMDNYMVGGAANAALLNFTKALGNEGAPHGILVTGVNPGATKTERWNTMLGKWGAAKGVTPGQAEREILDGVPLKRAGTVDEVANLVVFLASDLSSYITGTTVNVDGGMARMIF